MATATRKSDERILLRPREAAAMLGVSQSTLCELRGAHPIYEPAVMGLLPLDVRVRGQQIGRRKRLFHVRQVELIAEAWVAGTDEDLETAWLRWQVFKSVKGEG